MHTSHVLNAGVGARDTDEHDHHGGHQNFSSRPQGERGDTPDPAASRERFGGVGRFSTDYDPKILLGQVADFRATPAFGRHSIACAIPVCEKPERAPCHETPEDRRESAPNDRTTRELTEPLAASSTERRQQNSREAEQQDIRPSRPDRPPPESDCDESPSECARLHADQVGQRRRAVRTLRGFFLVVAGIVVFHVHFLVKFQQASQL